MNAHRPSPAAPSDARLGVTLLLREALERGASDLHFEATAAGYDLRLRVDGLLETLRSVDRDTGRAYVNRLMVAAKLLTYRLDIPQEGRCQVSGAGELHTDTTPVTEAPGTLDIRVSLMPTNHGLRAVVRLPAELTQPRTLEELGLPDAAFDGLRSFASSDNGMLLLCGPAGSGKTTTTYALLQQITESDPGVSVVALEDPVERDLLGVTQIQVTPFGELTYERALRSMLRQDPQVLALGEIRDAATASVAVQAALSGHRLVSTLHAGTPAGAVVRLFEMGLERYQIAGALFGVVVLRLVRKLGDDGRYRGRVPVASFARLDPPVRDAVIHGGGQDTVEAALAEQPGYETLHAVAARLVCEGVTDDAEVRRVLGDA